MKSAARMSEIERGLTGLAKKVYALVPAESHWTLHDIHAESNRIGQHLERRVLEGTLESLVKSGLVKKDASGRFIRVRFKEEDMQEPNAPTPGVDAPQSKTPIDMLAPLIEEARVLSVRLSVLATDIESAALAIEDRLSAVKEETEEMRQFRALFQKMAGKL